MSTRHSFWSESGTAMPAVADSKPWRELTERAEVICEAARHDPYDPRLAESIQALSAELNGLSSRELAGSALTDAGEWELRAAAHAAAGEAWLALLDSTRALAEFDAALKMLGRDGSHSSACPAAQAQALCGRGKCLVDLGRPAEAVPELDASIGWYTTQGDAADEAQQSLLSQAWHTLGLARADNGDHARALEATARAVALRDSLAERDAARYQLALSRSMRNMGNWLRALGRNNEALIIRRQTVSLRREARDRCASVAATLALAQSLQILADEAEDNGEAVPAMEESLLLYRYLMTKYPVPLLAEFVTCLDTAAKRFSAVGLDAKALSIAQEATRLRRELAAKKQQKSLPDRARRLRDLAASLLSEGRRAEAVRALSEAVQLYHTLVCQDEGAHSSELAQALIELGGAYSKIGAHGNAAVAISDAVETLRTLVAGDRKTYIASLAEGLRCLGDEQAALRKHAPALQTYEEAVSLTRELLAADRRAFMHSHASALCSLGAQLLQMNQRSEAQRCWQEAGELQRVLVGRRRDAPDGNLFASMSALKAKLDASLASSERPDGSPDDSAWRSHVVNLVRQAIQLRDMGDRAGAARATSDAVDLLRGRCPDELREDRSLLAWSLDIHGVALLDVGRRVEALGAGEEAAASYRELVASNRKAFLHDLAGSVTKLAMYRLESGRLEEGRQAAAEAVEIYRELVAVNRVAHLPNLAAGLVNLGIALWRLGRFTEAVSATMEAVTIRRELVASNHQPSFFELAKGLDNLGVDLRDDGRPADGLKAATEAEESFRRLVLLNRPRFLPDLARCLSNLSLALEAMARPADALRAAEEAAQLYRELAEANRVAWLPMLSASVNNLGLVLSRLGRRLEAAQVAEEAVILRREQAAANREAYLPDLALSLINLGNRQSDVGRRAEALETSQEAVALYRELVATNRGAFLHYLAASLGNVGNRLSEAGRRAEALAAAEEALGLQRELVAVNRGAFLPDLARRLNQAGMYLDEAGRRAEAVAAWREAGRYTLELRPDNPDLWSWLCRVAVRGLDTPQDLRDFHLWLLGLLTDHRELAWNTEHAQVFLDLQAEVAARVWELLATLPAEEGELLDEAVAALVAAMQSPDLARWIDARGSGGGPLARLAELKREVIEAEQLLAALRKGLIGGDGEGMRTGSGGSATEEQRAALSQELDRQSAQAQALRQAFRDERERLTAEDPRFAAAFAPLGPQALRSIARHAQGGALLCVLEFGGPRDTRSSSATAARAVAALLHADGRRARLLELAEVSELGWHAERYAPEAGDRRRGPMRGAPHVATRSASSESAANANDPVKGITELLAERMSRAFWAPLQQALHESGVAVDRLHVCLHGTTQQLPLALRQESDCPGVQIVPWPGLPYLRRAAMAAGAAATDAAKSRSAPWLIGHDCDWASEQPLPMVAVEAALLRELLQRHGQPVQQIRLAAQLHGRASALVACCHGGAEQAQFDHALHLGAEPLTVRQIVQENIGPPLALLPACHAGRTDEDAAGNALGVAAAFMLSGTRVVAASSKAVPDLLQPWLSTLTVWHAMQGLPHHEAAALAREQFARLDFPAGYRSWLQQALPQALATIQPGGEEDEHIRGVHAQTALELVEERWPWEGKTKDLFSADAARREEATRSVVQGILVPRGGEAGARALAAEAREMAAFVFVYGVDGRPRS